MHISKMYKKSIVLVLLLLPFFVNGQGDFKTYDKRNIHINFPDSIVKVQINNQKNEVTPVTGKDYYWYYAGKIHFNTGGYRGNLLDGKYTVFTPEKDLLASGKFKNGLKHGVWKRWYRNGAIQSIVHWKDGLKNGVSRFFDKDGELTKKLSYKKDLLHGECVYFNDGEKETIKYRKGEKVMPFTKKIKQIFHSDSTRQDTTNTTKEEK
jgi:antitoxin component YwqK of YwqJK toxin-antitoxin module